MIRLDLSAITLILSNLLVITLALMQNWDISTLLWVYWIQSIIIGFFQFFRILSLKTSTAFFFAFHYGFFHFIYAIFLSNFFQYSLGLNLQDLLLGSGIFFANHFFSFFQNESTHDLTVGVSSLDRTSSDVGKPSTLQSEFSRDKVRDEKLKPNIGRLMFQPYIRIIPMHLVLILGMILGNQSKLIFFLILKTLADLVTHNIKHKY